MLGRRVLLHTLDFCHAAFRHDDEKWGERGGCRQGIKAWQPLNWLSQVQGLHHTPNSFQTTLDSFTFFLPLLSLRAAAGTAQYHYDYYAGRDDILLLTSYILAPCMRPRTQPNSVCSWFQNARGQLGCHTGFTRNVGFHLTPFESKATTVKILLFDHINEKLNSINLLSFKSFVWGDKSIGNHLPKFQVSNWC